MPDAGVQSSWLIYGVYLIPLAALFVWALRRRAAFEAESRRSMHEAQEAGLTLPPSLHPVVDPLKCIGCASCVHACPEFPAHQVLGLIDRKATLVSPTDCIGHGACQKACPTGAISLVFGTAERGVDLPLVNPDFSTDAPGVYVAGELGGMGLIRNAIEQGSQAIEAIGNFVRSTASLAAVPLDVVIIGAGPAGIAATLGAMERGLRYETVEQHGLGGTVAHFPRGKIVMTAPARLPQVGPVSFRETTKEVLMEFWNKVQRDTGMRIRYGERLVNVARGDDGVIRVDTDRGSYCTRAVLLAIGRRGSPRCLGVPGEDLPKVTYSLADPQQYEDRRILVVGGGDSALEAACALAEVRGTQVALSYRGSAFTRAKRRNRERIEAMGRSGSVEVFLESEVVAIEPRAVEIETPSGRERLANDAVVICAGGVVPDALLRQIGVRIETRYGTV